MRRSSNSQRSTPTSTTPPNGSSVPLTPAQTLKTQRDNLTDFEQSEVLEYPQIYFTGNTPSKIQASPSTGTCNHGCVRCGPRHRERSAGRARG